MLTITLMGPSQAELKSQLFVAEQYADIIELRADLYDVEGIASHKPLLLTGFKKLNHISPVFVDFPYNACPERFADFVKEHPKIKVICSYHNFEETPEDLDAILQEMRQKKAYIYKIATMGKSTLDALRMLLFVRRATDRGIKVVGHCMGEDGQVSRILGPVYGNAMTYSCLGTPVAPGQLDARAMLELYRAGRLNKKTKIYGLIGDPITFSPGHKFHNKSFDDKRMDAIYVKMRITAGELEKFFDYATQLGFQGLSVTMPLKEEVLKFTHCKELSCNTIKFTSSGLEGRNTDGEAVVEAIKKRTPLKDKTVVILGAGGSSKVIAAAASRCGAKLVILNRTLERAQELADRFGGEAYPLDQFPEVSKKGYDILINGTSVGFGANKRSPISLDSLLPNKIVFDATSTAENTDLITAAAESGCACITGKEMYELQAVKQHQFWFE